MSAHMHTGDGLPLSEGNAVPTPSAPALSPSRGSDPESSNELAGAALPPALEEVFHPIGEGRLRLKGGTEQQVDPLLKGLAGAEDLPAYDSRTLERLGRLAKKLDRSLPASIQIDLDLAPRTIANLYDQDSATVSLLDSRGTEVASQVLKHTVHSSLFSPRKGRDHSPADFIYHTMCWIDEIAHYGPGLLVPQGMRDELFFNRIFKAAKELASQEVTKEK